MQRVALPLGMRRLKFRKKRLANRHKLLIVGGGEMQTNRTGFLNRYSAWLLLALLAACQSAPVPKGVKVGKPYSVGGKMYYPEHDPSYDETGIASWYGPGFHGSS